MSNTTINQRVEMLRAYMQRNGLSAFIVPTTDPHMSEYTPARWQTRAWLTGFDGSAGTAVVTADKAALWTDSRYFIAAASALDGTPFELMKQGTASTPGIGQWLGGVLGKGSTVGVDGTVVTGAFRNELETELSPLGISVDTSHDPFDEIYPDRPALPTGKIEIQPIEYAGETCESKMERILALAAERHCKSVVVSALDDIAWTLNLRGSDVECNPVFVSYLLLSRERKILFVDETKITAAVANHLAEAGVETMPYGAFFESFGKACVPPVLLSDKANCALQGVAAGIGCVVAPSLPEKMKAVKNAAEIDGFRRAMERDGVAVVTFMSCIKKLAAEGRLTEMGVDREMTALRAAQPLFRGLSFATIAAYGAHAAIVHYEADEKSDIPLEPRGMILIDSGAQYLDGTTDITRTVALGPVTDEEKRAYTLTLKGHIMLSQCVFPDKASGTQIDCCARYHMWQSLMNYGHGTGHGVGSYLNVHEGPHQIRMNYMPEPLRAGMTVTDEPGIYCEGKYGVRIENTLLIVPAGESQFGSFLKFEPLTLCPIDTAPIDWSLVTPYELAWLNDYHAEVRRRLSPLIDDKEVLAWLADNTAPLDAAGRHC